MHTYDKKIRDILSEGINKFITNDYKLILSKSNNGVIFFELIMKNNMHLEKLNLQNFLRKNNLEFVIKETYSQISLTINAFFYAPATFENGYKANIISS